MVVAVLGAVAAVVVLGVGTPVAGLEAVAVVAAFGAVVVVAGFLALVGVVWAGVDWAREYRFRLVKRIKAMNIFFILEFFVFS